MSYYVGQNIFLIDRAGHILELTVVGLGRKYVNLEYGYRFQFVEEFVLDKHNYRTTYKVYRNREYYQEVSLHPRRVLGLINQLKKTLQDTHYTDIDSKLLSLDMHEEWKKVCSSIPY